MPAGRNINKPAERQTISAMQIIRNVFFAACTLLFAAANAQSFEPAPLNALSLTAPTDAAAVGRARAFETVPLAQGALDAIIAVGRCGEMPVAAEALFASRRFADAAAAYGELLNTLPRPHLMQLAQLRMAQCDIGTGNVRQALDMLRAIDGAALSLAQAAELDYCTGICLMQQGDGGAAVAHLEAVAAGDGPLRSAACFYLAAIAYNNGDYSRAHTLLQRVDAGSEPGIRRDVYISGIELERGNDELALAAARRALALPRLSAAERAAADYAAGVSLWRLGRQQDAVPHLEKHVRNAGVPAPQAQYLLGVDAYRVGRNEAAVQYLSNPADAGGDLGARASLMLGQALYAMNRRDAAAAAFRNAADIAEAPEDIRRQADYNYAVARLYGANVPFSSASEILEDFLQRYPDGPYTDRVRQYLAQGYLADRNYQLALQSLEAIQAPSQQVMDAKAYVLYSLANSAINNGKPTEAERYAARVPADGIPPVLQAEMNLTRGRIALAQRQYAAAKSYLQGYLRRGNILNKAKGQYFLGYALFNSGDYAAADAAFDGAASSGVFSGREMADILNRRADIAAAGSRFGEAARLYGRALDADRSGGDYAAFRQARMYGYDRNYHAELEALAQFRRDYPSSALMPEVLLENAAANVADGHNDAALQCYDTLINDYPLTAQGRQAYIQKAMTLLESGQRRQAEQAYMDVVRRYPSSAEAVQASNLLRAILADQGRGAEYLEFMNSVEGAPAVERSDAAALSFGSAVRAFRDNGDNTAMQRFLEEYPDAAEAEEAAAMLAEADYAADRTELALQRWQELEPRASDAAMSMRARMGIIRAARDLGDIRLAGETAAKVLQSSSVPGADLTEATYARACYLATDSTQLPQALELWQGVAPRTDELYGAMSAFALAETLYSQGRLDGALEAAQALTTSRSPHRYWVARAFILQADILKAQDKPYEAREYLRALLRNYPGNETDIRVMAQERLDAME